MKRIALFFTVLIFSVWSLCAETWFVCAGSFSKYENAKERCVLLNNAGYDCFVGTAVKSDGTKLYRVMFLDDVMLRDDARDKKDQLLKADVIIKNKLTDLWICQAEMPSKDSKDVYLAKPKEEEKVAAVPVVIDVEKEVSAIEEVLVPELPSLIDAIETIEAIEIPELPSVAVPEVTIPGISESVISCISQFPENPLYVVEDFSIADYTNYESNPYNEMYGTDEFFDEMHNYKELSAGAYVKMINAMTDKEIEMIVLKAEDGLSEEFISEEVIYYWDSDDMINETEFKLNYGKMISAVSGDENGIFVCGVSEDSKMVVYISAEDYSEAEITDFLATSFKPSAAGIYKELLKSFMPVSYSGEK